MDVVSFNLEDATSFEGLRDGLSESAFEIASRPDGSSRSGAPRHLSRLQSV